jgi:hypothetical protein
MMRAESSHPTKSPVARLDSRDHLSPVPWKCYVAFQRGDIGSLFGNEIGDKAMELKFRACVLAQNLECRDLRDTNHKISKGTLRKPKRSSHRNAFTFLHVVVFCAAFRLWAFLRRGQRRWLHISPRETRQKRSSKNLISFLISYSSKMARLRRQNVDLLPVAVDGKPLFLPAPIPQELGPIGTYSIKELRTMNRTCFELKPDVPHNNFSSEKTVLEINCMKKPELYAHVKVSCINSNDFFSVKMGEPRFSWFA